MRTLFFLLISVSCSAQVVGKFLGDTIRVGRPVAYALSYRHVSSAEVFFPDSAHNFSPFVCLKRSYFTTQTTESISTDSIVYELVSFETSPLQYLAVPVYVYAQGDCTSVFPVRDSVVLKSSLTGSPRVIRNDLTFTPLATRLNYPLYLIFLVGILVFVGLINWFFGEAIARQWQLLQHWRRFIDFRRSFQRYTRSVRDTRSGIQNVERAVTLWKRYLERTENLPFTTFTSRETVEQFPTETRLLQALRDTDAVVYGGVYGPETQLSLRILLDLARRSYIRRRQIIITTKKNELV